MMKSGLDHAESAFTRSGNRILAASPAESIRARTEVVIIPARTRPFATTPCIFRTESPLEEPLVYAGRYQYPGEYRENKFPIVGSLVLISVSDPREFCGKSETIRQRS